MRDFMECFGVVLAIVAGTAVLIGGILYFKGRANSSWIRATRGIEIPWHVSAFLDVSVNNTDLAILAKPIEE